jgi:protein-tyrosine phosphatase
MTVEASFSETLSSSTFDRARGAPALAARYALFGLGALALAPLTRQVAWPLAVLCAWLGVSNLLLAHAYATNRVVLFGKRRDGTQSPLCVALMLPYLLLVWGFFWLKINGLRREPCWHEVSPGLYLGRRPRVSDLPKDCRLVVDLTSEFVEPRDVVGAYAYRCLPMLNRHVASDAEVRALLRELLEFSGPIYVHCGAGRGRSAMIVAALLVLSGKVDDVDAAEEMLKRARPGVHLHAAQKALIARQCAALQLGATRQSRSPSATPKCA